MLKINTIQYEYILQENGREKKTTNVTHARGNLQIQPILCKSSLKSKNVPKFQDVVKWQSLN